MDTFTTDDGYDLHYEVSGSGPPLVLVHGGCTDHHCFDPVLPLLSVERTCFAFDRRGMGAQNAAAAVWSLERGARDLLGFVGHVGGGSPVPVFGYSFGGLLTLAAAQQPHADVIERAVVYEPPADAPGLLPTAMIGEVRRRLQAGDGSGAARAFVQQTFLLADFVLDAMQAHPSWEIAMREAPTLAHELHIAGSVTPADLTLTACPFPVRYVLGRDGGNDGFRAFAAAVVELVPESDLVLVDGLPHFAIATNPAGIAAAVLDFL